MSVFCFRALLVGASLLTACRRAERRDAGALRDDFGAAVSVDAAPRRIVSLNPTTTEVLFAIGAGSRLVGRSMYDAFPRSALVVPNLGAALRPNVEAIIGAKPDLVVLYASQDNRAAADRLRQAGIATVALRIDSIAQFERDTRLLGRLTGDSARANTVVDSVRATLDRVRAATQSLARPSVFFHTWDRPLITIGGGSFLNELVDIAGGRNVYGDLAGPSGIVTVEDVVRRNPDYVLASPITAASLRADPRWQALPAVRAGHVLVFDTTIVGRPSVTLGAAARSLADLLHPGAVR
jgi:ABC-type Fe3+-hydroxamate transport system substrate-binding protein